MLEEHRSGTGGKPLLQIRDLRVTYSAAQAKPIRAVDEVSLEISSGEVIGILGESGCGKSTLASAVIQSLPSSAKIESGEIFFRDRDLLRLRERELSSMRGREISLIPQDPALSLNPVMTVGTQISEVLRAHLPLKARQRRERVQKLLGEMGFEQPAEIYNAFPHQLSGGQRQRIVIAQAVSCNPSLVIADEATSKLDASLQTEIMELLSASRNRQQTTLLIISHDPMLVGRFADRIAVMYGGRIVEIGKSAEMMQRPLHPYTQALMRIAKASAIGEVPKKRRLPAIDGEVFDPAEFRNGCRFEPRCQERMEVCRHHDPSNTAPEAERLVSCFQYDK
ncbi:MAG TPA: ABC transporter ATP-binding protein [Terriglobales bacterium]|nr:ABC transporter ATP-binding protein [Terriglobales bacterium]